MSASTKLNRARISGTMLVIISLYYNNCRVTVAYSWPWLDECETSQVEFGTTAHHTSTRDTAVRLFRLLYRKAIFLRARNNDEVTDARPQFSINKF